ncbi:sulfate transporter CysZ [Aliikangiella sp. IMCC44359]|uniref:sulfate transporter CysZ n=1 Tax=Aliikangiella sp. IMCC44359 TaxID=3459125 RepID=UPI00403B098A
MQQTSLGGVHYLSKGLSLICKPGIRAFVFIPLLINLVLLTMATIYAFNSISVWYDSLQNSEYSIVQWLIEWLDWLLWPLIVVSVLIVVFFVFAFIANWIAAPFNGLLSEAVERHLAGKDFEDKPFKIGEFIGDIPRLLGREWRKFIYYLPRALGCLILFVTPLALFAPFVWFLFNAWMAGIQYIDYPMDNHKVPFNQMLSQVRNKRSGTFGFGALVMLFTMIPVVNILVMPVAVAGGTALWFDQYRNKP